MLTQGIPTTVLDHSVEILEIARAFGYRVLWRRHPAGPAAHRRGRARPRAGGGGGRPEQSLKIVTLGASTSRNCRVVAAHATLTHWNAAATWA